MKPLAALALALLLVACSDSGDDDDSPGGSTPSTDGGGTDGGGTGGADGGADGGNTGGDGDGEPPRVPPPPADRPLAEPAGLYESDGYGAADMLRVDVRTVTTAGICTADDQSGCTLADVIADVDPADDLKVDIPVHFQAPDFPDDGLETNAELRQRGASSRTADQKSFRVELKGKGVRWRHEDKLQLNKHPFDPSKIRNKLSFDLMSRIRDFPSSRTQFVNLWIDDGAGPVDYGVFTHTEAAGDEYFENRGWDKDGAFYKVEEFLFSPIDATAMAVDEAGEPIDEDRFETRLEIEQGDDHRKVLEMITAVNDQSRTFDAILAQHFDEDNVLTWVAVNFLLRQLDAVTHNFYLYNPAGSDVFYFAPWDYDQTFGVEPFPENSLETAALSQRLSYGYAKGSASNFLKRFYAQPGIHAKVLAKADELRNGPFQDSTIADLASRYNAVVTPVANAGPDEFKYQANQSPAFAGFVAETHTAMQTSYSIPLPPNLVTPRIEDGLAKFRWSEAHDVTGGTISYDIDVSLSADFEPSSSVFSRTGIPGDPSGRVGLDVPAAEIGSGTRYVRLIARSSKDPARFWQIASNRETILGVNRIGVVAFDAP